MPFVKSDAKVVLFFYSAKLFRLFSLSLQGKYRKREK